MKKNVIKYDLKDLKVFSYFFVYYIKDNIKIEKSLRKIISLFFFLVGGRELLVRRCSLVSFCYKECLLVLVKNVYFCL